MWTTIFVGLGCLFLGICIGVLAAGLCHMAKQSDAEFFRS